MAKNQSIIIIIIMILEVNSQQKSTLVRFVIFCLFLCELMYVLP